MNTRSECSNCSSLLEFRRNEGGRPYEDAHSLQQLIVSLQHR